MKPQTVTSALSNLFRHVLVRNLVVAGALLLIMSSLIGVQAVALAAPPPPRHMLDHTVLPEVASSQLLGHHSANAALTVELVLHPSNQAQIDSLVAALYDAKSPQYHHWLPTGAFAAQFAPTHAQMGAVRAFLGQAGLRVVAGAPSVFLLRASGSVEQVETAFQTRINDYVAKDGTRFYANASAVQIPGNLVGIVDGVLGLDNIFHLNSDRGVMHRSAGQPSYGGGPGGTGLTPSQIAGLYLANPLYATGDHGAGSTLGLFELSGYTASDITTYCTQFSLTCPTLTDINVDGGPTNHKGASEVELDIEMQIALADATTGILVYNAPNTGTGLIDQYAKIASDNLADSISTSWGNCEPKSVSAIWDAEFTSFRQMALQGQTIFAAAGDDGAFDCLSTTNSNGSDQVRDPASNPYMTGVGGTSFGSFDPGTNPNPVYPSSGESVWNDNCTPTTCDKTHGSGGGGGNSKIWARPPYQVGPGVAQSYSKSSPWCDQPAGTPCREVPDVSMNADPNTGYAVYCTDAGDTGCSGWFQLGGTSAAAPLWAAIIDLTDSFHSNRLGEASFSLYNYDTANGYKFQFHDVSSGNNGWYPARANYDLATGIGTPRIYYLATQLP